MYHVAASGFMPDSGVLKTCQNRKLTMPAEFQNFPILQRLIADKPADKPADREKPAGNFGVFQNAKRKIYAGFTYVYVR